jgi:hypothetical protein
MKLERCTEEQFLTVLDDFGPWNYVNVVMKPWPVDSDQLGDVFHLYIEVNPCQHYRAEYRPGHHTWQQAIDLARDIARSEDPDTFNSYMK